MENEIIPCIFAEKGPYNMTMWFVVHLIVTDTIANFSYTNLINFYFNIYMLPSMDGVFSENHKLIKYDL